VGKRRLLAFDEGERAIIGGLFVDPSRIAEVMDTVRAGDFANPALGEVFGTMVALHGEGEPVDWVTVTARLKARELLDRVGGPAFLAELADAVPSAANISHYCNVVRERSTRRTIMAACRDAEKACRERDEGVHDAVLMLEKACYDATVGVESPGLRSLSEVIHERAESLTAARERKQGLQTGFLGIDLHLNGLHGGELIIIAGPPGMGKTALALCMGFQVAAHSPVYLFSHEMTARQIADRAISALTGIPVHRLRSNRVHATQEPLIKQAADRADTLRMAVDDTAGLTPLDVYTRASSWAVKSRQRPGLIIVDYLQIMRPEHSQANREREVGSISTDLKNYAKRLECPIVAVSQLRRPSQERLMKTDRKPKLSDLRDSGQLEQDAHAVLAIYRPGYYHPDEEGRDQREAYCLILKNRDGPTGEIPLLWDAATATFRNGVQEDARSV
jgi:replicative DNA helicase